MVWSPDARKERRVARFCKVKKCRENNSLSVLKGVLGEGGNAPDSFLPIAQSAES